MGFQLTSENYYSDIANYEYMSVSQFKDFAGTYGKLGCEECAMAKIRGKYVRAILISWMSHLPMNRGNGTRSAL